MHPGGPARGARPPVLVVAVPDRPASRRRQALAPLTGRELEVLRLLAAGKSNQRIARDLVVAFDTVKSR
jgi:ATP/maltotriose-dependent transcriptional regulator MalT